MLDRTLIPDVAARFKALGEPGRLLLVALLHDGEKSVNQLVAASGRSQPNVSQQLAGLLRAGLVLSRRDGNQVFYRVADPYLMRICDAVCASLERGAAGRPKVHRRA